MFKPRYVVVKAPGVGGHGPIPEDEPCIVIRAQDRLACSVLSFYLSEYQDRAVVDDAVISELEAHREAVLAWQVAHPDKVKWADR
jgi:hypothetical protein